MSHLSDALTARLRQLPSEPLVTWYGQDGARTELSVVTFTTAVAKTAGVLLDDWDVPPGATVRLQLPLHWQLPVWLAACDLAGLVVVWDDRAATDVVVSDDPAIAMSSGPEFPVVTATTPFGLPGTELPPEVLDHARDAMGQPDVFAGTPGTGSWIVGAEVWDGSALTAAADRVGADACLQPGGRLLVTAPAGTPWIGLAVWATPLSLGAAVVLSPASAGVSTAAAEHTTATVATSREL